VSLLFSVDVIVVGRVRLDSGTMTSDGSFVCGRVYGSAETVPRRSIRVRRSADMSEYE